MKTTLLFFFSAVFVINSFAQLSSGNTQFTTQLNTITTAVPFLQIPSDARSTGMGDVGAATSPDAYSLHWNTSKLAFSDKKVEVGVSYSPWLHQLVDDIHYLHASGYTKIGNRHAIGASATYFSLGTVSISSPTGVLIKEFNPNEFEFVGAYAFRLSKRSALGINAKYIHSNLTDGITLGTVATKPGKAVAADVSYSYFNEDLSLRGYNTSWSLGVNISNLGNKMAYTTSSNQDFIPANLRIGSAYSIKVDEKHKIAAALDFNKLLVPTSPIRNANGQILSGKSNNVSSTVGLYQSFYDAPGNVFVNNSGAVVVEKNSRLKEELNEITIGGGLEYQYNDMVTVRGGYFYEHRAKGDRKYFTLGAGVKYSVVGIDVSYLAALKRTNPLANTVRFSLNFAI